MNDAARSLFVDTSDEEENMGQPMKDLSEPMIQELESVGGEVEGSPEKKSVRKTLLTSLIVVCGLFCVVFLMMLVLVVLVLLWTLIDRKPLKWECFGKDRKADDVCSGHGKCFLMDSCECEEGYFGADCHSHHRDFGNNTIIMISIDGFRHDYITKYADACPFINQIAQEGVRAKSMQTIFPSKTFPNHWTMVTGLYPETHGILFNHMWDPVFKTEFKLSNDESKDPRWWSGEPIWVTAEKYQIKSGVYFWPGSELKHQNMHASYWQPFDQKKDSMTRMKGLLEYVDKPLKERPKMMLGYIDIVDTQGHNYGPDHDEVRKAIKEVDDAIKTLYKGLEQRKLLDKIDIFIVSDHGMSGVSNERRVVLSDYSSNLHLFDYYNYGSVVDIFVKDKKNIDLIFDDFHNQNPKMTVYKKENIPERFHFKNHRRTPDIVLIAENRYIIVEKPDSRYDNHGTHGYDNEVEDMFATLIARGPHMKDKSFLDEQVKNVDLYELMCYILDVPPAANNGTLQGSNMMKLLKDEFI